MATLKELRSMTDKELTKEEVKLRKTLLKTVYELKTNQRRDTNKAKLLRREIAQIQTIRTEQSSSAAPSSSETPSAESSKKVEKKVAEAEQNRSEAKAPKAESSKEVEKTPEKKSLKDKLFKK